MTCPWKITLGVNLLKTFSVTCMLAKHTALLISRENCFKRFACIPFPSHKFIILSGGLGNGAGCTFPEEQQNPGVSFLNLKAPQWVQSSSIVPIESNEFSNNFTLKVPSRTSALRKPSFSFTLVSFRILCV